ncbi:organic cation transporter protein-like [Lineus longissimus]|uniref:organic cation transporter protein-like n=1 Tax=Lineus longissimus TaxID=88925 RepID=UPI00315CA2EF
MGTFDDILVQIGQFGRYQIMLSFLLCASFISTGWHTVSIVFIGAHRDHWCRVPGLEGLNETQRRSLVEPAYCGPNIKEDVCRQCYRNVLNISSISLLELTSWNTSGPLNASREIEKCDSWEYSSTEFTSTLLNQYDLVCDRDWLTSMLQTIYMAGYLVGCLFFGTISDRYGRLTAFLIALGLELVIAVSEIYIPFYSMFAVFRFLLGATAGAAYTCAYVYVLELTGPRYRAVIGVFGQWGFDVGVFLSVAVGYTVKDHINMQWIFAVPPVIFLVAKLLVPESPRWLVTKGRFEEAEVFLRKVAKINRRQFPENTKLESFIDHSANDDEKATSALDLFRTPNMRRRSLVSFYVWFSASAVYYGLMLGDRGFGFSIYANVAQSGAAAILAYFVCVILYNKIGRRLGIMSMSVTAGVCIFICIPLLNMKHLYPLLFTVSFLGKIANCAGFHGAYLHSSEYYPTVVRNVGVGCGSMFARVGGLVAPQLVRLAIVWQPLPAIILGVVAITAGLSNLLLPETLNKKLPETIEDGENFGTKKQKDEDANTEMLNYSPASNGTQKA